MSTGDLPGRRPTGARSGGVRRGLVLGGGGLLGLSWMAATLSVLEHEEGFDARDVDVVVGTSAGSILAALLGCGVGTGPMLRHQRGEPLPDDPPISYSYETDDRSGPGRPEWRFGSPGLAIRAVRHPGSIPPLVAMSAVLPPGRGTLAPVGRMIDALTEYLPAAAPGAGTEPFWPPQPRVWISALDYRAGQRVVFGRDPAPTPTPRLAQAVMASCAIPGWFAPALIDGRQYVDGGTYSPTSVDLLAGAGLDEVWVLAPMAAFAYDHPRSALARVERRYRRLVTRRVLSEAVLVREWGTEVTVLAPGPEDLDAMGANLMNPRRRALVLETALRTSTAALRQHIWREPVVTAG